MRANRQMIRENRDRRADRERTQFHGPARRNSRETVLVAPAPTAVFTRRADDVTIAAAEIEHRMRFPKLYGITPAQLAEMRSNKAAAIERHLATVKARVMARRAA